MVGAIEHDFTQPIMAPSAHCGRRGAINGLLVGCMVKGHLALESLQPGEIAVVFKRGVSV